MKYDILIVNGLILTMNSHKEIIEPGFIAISGETIVDIGKDASAHTAEKIIDATNCIVMPGLINTHTHAAMTLFRGLADDLPLQTWLEDYIWPAEAKFINENTIKIGTKLAIIEMIQSGTTTFNDMYFYEDIVAQVSVESGIRAFVGEGIIDFPTPNSKNPADAIKYNEGLLKKWKDHPLIEICWSAHSPYTCSKNLLHKILDSAKKDNSLFHIHVAETKNEKKMISENNNVTPVQYLNDENLLYEKMVAAHCVHLSEKDMDICLEKRVGIAHNPVSNMKLASGAANFPLWKKKNITKIGLGTDGATSNNNLSMLKDMNIAALLHKNHFSDPKVASAEEIVEMATIGGAKVLCNEHKIGSLEQGKKADIILIDYNQPHSTPMYNPYSHIVYSAQSSDVKEVIINGKTVMENRNLTTIDVEKVLYETRKISKEIKMK